MSSRPILAVAVQAEFDCVKERLETTVSAALGDQAATMPSMADLQYAQNVLRTCMEAVFQKMIPYDERVCAEMAVRLASYAISAAPMEDHEALVALVVQGLPSAHAQRMAKGIRISTEWQMANGSTQPNFPEED